ncbi:MAG: secondary thiamine-phosphate synthase enzyme YjbQ [Candidatus Omnitrophica bacterium]|nr:secondary thiamine-phosphate synthase enzyme YjbQ [Candidatus Omnitrophota bacterium]
MRVEVFRIQLNTKGNNDIIDITADIAARLTESGLKKGIACVSVIGSTASITTMEYEPALVTDMKRLFEKIAPSGVGYEHDKTWGDANGYSHLRASLLGPSVTIPFEDGGLCLGTWQQIVLLDFDNRHRKRDIRLHFTGV